MKEPDEVTRNREFLQCRCVALAELKGSKGLKIGKQGEQRRERTAAKECLHDYLQHKSQSCCSWGHTCRRHGKLFAFLHVLIVCVSVCAELAENCGRFRGAQSKTSTAGEPQTWDQTGKQGRVGVEGISNGIRERWRIREVTEGEDGK